MLFRSTEAEVVDGAVRAVVVGIGVNVQWQEFPPEIAETATACNLVAGHDVSRDALLDAFVERYGARLVDLDAVPEDYRARLGTLGQRVRIELADAAFEGDAVGVLDDGSLEVLTDDGSRRTVTAGDVVHLRPA